MPLALQTPPAVEAQASAAPSENIVVTGVREGTVALDLILAAQRAFDAGRATFAPQGVLHFRLSAEGCGPVRLTLRQGETSIPVALDEQGRFTLPALPAGEWELVHDRGRTPMNVRVMVYSPGTTETDRRLGDLRLQCRAGREVIKAGQSFMTRTAFGALGGCGSTKIAFYTTPSRPAASAEAVEGAMR